MKYLLSRIPALAAASVLSFALTLPISVLCGFFYSADDPYMAPFSFLPLSLLFSLPVAVINLCALISGFSLMQWSGTRFHSNVLAGIILSLAPGTLGIAALLPQTVYRDHDMQFLLGCWFILSVLGGAVFGLVMKIADKTSQRFATGQSQASQEFQYDHRQFMERS